MIEELMRTWSTFINDVSGGNEMVAAAVTVWVIGVATYILRNTPARLWDFITTHATTSMSFNNAGWDNKINMYNFVVWSQPYIKHAWSRTISIETNPDTHWNNDKEFAKLAMGYGFHIFIWDKRLFWINKQKIESSGSENQKEEIVIYTYGRSHEPFKRMLKAMTPPKREDVIKLFRFEDHEWVVHGKTPPKRSIDSLAIDPEMINGVISEVQHFKDNREWFYDRGLPYKLTYLLHGATGTGKTSMIKALASHFKMNICMMNINAMNDSTLEEAFSEVPQNSMIIVEDFDSAGAVKDRTVESENQFGEALSKFSPLTLTGILNSLDGVAPLDDCVIFLTTNHLEKIDTAVYRKGRVDHVIEVGAVEGKFVKEYSERMFPDYDFDDYLFEDVVGCVLNEAIMYAKEDPEAYLDLLFERGVVSYIGNALELEEELENVEQ